MHRHRLSRHLALADGSVTAGRWAYAASMPMLFLNGSNDGAYPLDSYMKTYELVQSPKNIAIKAQAIG